MHFPSQFFTSFARSPKRGEYPLNQSHRLPSQVPPKGCTMDLGRERKAKGRREGEKGG